MTIAKESSKAVATFAIWGFGSYCCYKICNNDRGYFLIIPVLLIGTMAFSTSCVWHVEK